MDPKSCRSDNITVNVLICLAGLPDFAFLPNCTVDIYDLQERNRAFPAPTEARLLREAGHEGHPHRPAHDLHPAPHVHGDIHEEVTGPSRWVSPYPPQHCINPPRSLTPVALLCSILPFEAVVCMYRFLGADKCMYPFIAQRKQATNNNEAKNGI